MDTQLRLLLQEQQQQYHLQHLQQLPRDQSYIKTLNKILIESVRRTVEKGYQMRSLKRGSS